MRAFRDRIIPKRFTWRVAARDFRALFKPSASVYAPIQPRSRCMAATVMTEQSTPNRCRVVLIAPLDEPIARFGASARGDLGRRRRLAHHPGATAARLPSRRLPKQSSPIVQEAGIAVIIADDTRIAGRVDADGVHLEAARPRCRRRSSAWQDKISVGAGGAKTREDALELGETRPDYIFFGKFGFDNKPEPHHRNLSPGAWWAEMIEIPCIVLARLRHRLGRGRRGDGRGIRRAVERGVRGRRGFRRRRGGSERAPRRDRASLRGRRMTASAALLLLGALVSPAAAQALDLPAPLDVSRSGWRAHARVSSRCSRRAGADCPARANHLTARHHRRSRA